MAIHKEIGEYSLIYSIGISSCMSLSMIVLLMSGLVNPITHESFLSAWKQIVIFIDFVLIYLVARRCKLYMNIYLYVCISSLFLLLYAVYSLESIISPLYNIFFYVSWLPFFIWGANGGVRKFIYDYRKFIVFYLIFSCVGLILDLKTDMFGFLMVRSDVLTLNYFSIHHIAKRAVFIFTAPTLVMPVLGGVMVFLFLNEITLFKIMLSIVVISIVAFTTGSANSLLIGSVILFGVLYYRLSISLRLFITLSILVSLSLSIASFLTDDVIRLFGGQIDRIADNMTMKSQGNVGRAIAWIKAINIISHFSIIQNLFGAGIGCTNSNYNNHVLYTHGESSFFQSYIEGGLFGTTLRILPFFMFYMYWSKSSRGRNMYVAGYIASVLVAYSIAPLFGNISSQALLGAIAGHQVYISKLYG